MFAFLLIVGASFYVIATSLISLVGDYLFEQRIRTDRGSVEALATELAPLWEAARTEELQTLLDEAGGQLGGRLMLIDRDGKVQVDTFSQLIGSRMQLNEVTSVLAGQQDGAYGVHQLDDSGQPVDGGLFAFLRPLDASRTWAGYLAAPLTSASGMSGVLLFSSPVQEMIQSLYTIQDRMILYFLVAAVAALAAALIFSQVITRPIAALTRVIQKMGKGDLSARVPVRGSGELRRLAETFNTMSEKLETLDQSRNQFVSNASHELKTPLATMKIMLESVIYQPEMEQELRNEFLADINNEIDRLNTIISDLLTLVRMDTQGMRLKRQNMDLSHLLADVVHKLEPMAAKKDQLLTLKISGDCPMYADESKLTQVAYNIIDNAIKYTQAGGRIKVTLERVGRNVTVAVKDNGPGIPEKDQTHIFDRFYRVDKARSRETGGTGLGLSIVHQIVMLHGGEITVESQEGKGSLFKVELPVHQG
ncbi:MAG: HAMP domain-containing protein [Clostridia bacterium]|nr:HAMP domain-containing protein [Clostridia bacterium]